MTNSVDVSVTPNAECLIYLPLYNGTSMVEIGILPAISSARRRRANGQVRPIVFYGTSITHGGCASRPAWPLRVAGRLWMRRWLTSASRAAVDGARACDLVAEIDASVTCSTVCGT